MSEKEIAEIEERLEPFRFTHGLTYYLSSQLISTVKELRKENTEQRELLREAASYTRHHPECSYHPRYGNDPCDCGFIELQKQIEEKVK